MRNCLISEAKFSTSRSSGPGGQHVNKTETRVELRWSPSGSSCLDRLSRLRVMHKLGKRLTREGELILTCDTHRSQHMNRAEVTGRFLDLVEKCLVKEKERRPTSPTRTSIEKRIMQKKHRSDIKQRRKPPSAE